jgi:hypothetical protein
VSTAKASNFHSQITTCTAYIYVASVIGLTKRVNVAVRGVEMGNARWDVVRVTQQGRRFF